MKHPSEYTTIPLGAIHVMVVDTGTVITDERSGESATIDDSTWAVKGKLIYCTEMVFEAMRDAILPTPPTGGSNG